MPQRTDGPSFTLDMGGWLSSLGFPHCRSPTALCLLPRRHHSRKLHNRLCRQPSTQMAHGWCSSLARLGFRLQRWLLSSAGERLRVVCVRVPERSEREWGTGAGLVVSRRKLSWKLSRVKPKWLGHSTLHAAMRLSEDARSAACTWSDIWERPVQGGGLQKSGFQVAFSPPAFQADSRLNLEVPGWNETGTRLEPAVEGAGPGSLLPRQGRPTCPKMSGGSRCAVTLTTACCPPRVTLGKAQPLLWMWAHGRVAFEAVRKPLLVPEGASFLGGGAGGLCRPLDSSNGPGALSVTLA